MQTIYNITKQHLTGLLRGLTTTEATAVRFEVGQEITSPLTGSRYRVIKVEEVLQAAPAPSKQSRNEARAAEREWLKGF